MTIKNRMMLFILGITVVIYITTLTTISLNLRKNYIEEGKELVDTRVLQMANNIKSRMNEDLSVAKSIAAIVIEFSELPETERIETETKIFNSIINDHPEYEAVWMSWELSSLDPSWDKPNGRMRHTLFRKDGTLAEAMETIDTVYEKLSGDYYRIRENPNLEMSEPYISDDYVEGLTNTLWITSPCVPLMKNGEFSGLLGTDYTLDAYAELAMIDHNIYENGYSFMLSNGGVLVSHSSQKTTKESTLNSLGFAKNTDADMRSAINQGIKQSFVAYDEMLEETVYVSFAPVLPSDSILPWAVGIAVPKSELIAPYQGVINLTIILGLVGLLILSIVIFKVSQSITRPIETTNRFLKSVSEGNVNFGERLETNGTGEIAEMTKSVNNLIEDLHYKAELSAEIGKGNLEIEYELKNEKDILGNSLLQMKENLISVITETETVVARASLEGKLDARINTDNKEGAWKDISEAINGLLRSFSNPLNSLNQIIDGMANGDLTNRYTNDASGDIKHMADNLNLALNNLNVLLGEVAESSDVIGKSTEEMMVFSEEMSSGTTEIAAAIAEMSSGAQTQVAKVDESSSLIEGILDSANEMEVHANKINISAKKVAKNGEEGITMMNEVTGSMKEIAQFSNLTTGSINVLMERSKEIERVLGVITEIAAQTNLLALNAAIEAAQAGDAGRGFAVVAEEIRKLAEDSKKSANEIERLIISVQKDTGEASKVITEMNTKVKSGESIAGSASSSFNEIFKSSNEALSLTEGILKATSNQIKGIGEVVNITENIVVIAEETAAGTEEVTSAAGQMSVGMKNYTDKTQSLVEIATSLQENIRRMKIQRKK